MSSRRLNITLDADLAAKLKLLADRVHVNEGTLARSLLSAAIADADPNADRVTDVLDGIDGAWDRAQSGRADARAGRTISLDAL